MKTYSPRRSVVYQSLARLLRAAATAQGVILLAVLCFSGRSLVMEWLPWHLLFLGAVAILGLWVAEWCYFFIKKTRLSIDATKLSFVDADGRVDADWSSVSNVQIRRWELFIWLPRRVLTVPLLSRKEQREAYDAWFAVRGLSLSKASHLKAVHPLGGATKSAASDE